jgi:hypothetical protein
MGWQCGEVVMQTEKGEIIIVGYDGSVFTIGHTQGAEYVLVRNPGEIESKLFVDGQFLMKQ